MKNEYFQENLEKRIKIIRKMILSKIPNEILERKSKSQGKRRFFGTLFGLITSKKIFISLWYRRSPCLFTLKKCFFLEFFFNKNSHWPCGFESFSSWFWQDLCFVSDPISLVNPNNSQFCIFIIKKCHPPWVFYGFSSFKFKSFSLGFTFSFANFILNFGKYHFPCDFDSLFQIFLKIFIFHLICKYIFSLGFQRKKKGKNNYKWESVRQQFLRRK